VQLLQFAFRYILERAKSDRRLAFKQCLGVFTAERFNHGKNSITFDVLFQALFTRAIIERSAKVGLSLANLPNNAS